MFWKQPALVQIRRMYLLRTYGLGCLWRGTACKVCWDSIRVADRLVELLRLVGALRDVT